MEPIVKRSIWSVVAGVIFVIVVTTVVDVAFHLLEIYPRDQPLDNSRALVATSYRVVIGVIGAYLTASLAPRKPMKHALVLGVVGACLGLIGVAVSWGRNLGPMWYPIALVVLAIPQSWLGGKLHASYASRASSGPGAQPSIL